MENGVSPSEAVMSIDPVLPYDFDLSCTFADVVLVVIVAELESPVEERSDDGTVQLLLLLALLVMPNISLIGENCGWRTNFPT